MLVEIIVLFSILTCNTVEHDLIDVSEKNSISTPTGNTAEHGFIDINGENIVFPIILVVKLNMIC